MDVERGHLCHDAEVLTEKKEKLLQIVYKSILYKIFPSSIFLSEPLK